MTARLLGLIASVAPSFGPLANPTKIEFVAATTSTPVATSAFGAIVFGFPITAHGGREAGVAVVVLGGGGVTTAAELVADEVDDATALDDEEAAGLVVAVTSSLR